MIEIRIVLLVNGLTWLWLRANKAGLLCESPDGLAQTTEETTIYLHSVPDITAGNNGHREPMWYAPTHELDVAELTACKELDR
jgi:hypothetical protein